jgi:glyoxylase-like metal-dependent hydrolase (beta-lactamase superfamily II)
MWHPIEYPIAAAKRGQIALTRRGFVAGAIAGSLAGSALAFVTGNALAKAPALGHQVLSAYRHTVGSVEVIALSDGAFDLPVQMFPKADPAETTKILTSSGAPTDKLGTAVNAFLVNTGDKLVLIDSGAGQLFGPTLGRFAGDLVTLGIDPATVDVIAMTHLHPDHFGGLLTADAKLAFPNAAIFIADADIKLWLDEAIAAKAPADNKPFFDQARMMVGPYVAAQKYQPAVDGKEVVAGVTAIAAPGHTPGHTMYRISSGNQSLLIWGDIVHSAPLQFPHPEWAIAFDTDQDLAIATRKKVFDMTSTDKLTIAGAHLPFPGIGHVVNTGSGYQYAPVFWAPG